jgi:glycosidase
MYLKAWPHNPTIYEINTWAWLSDLGDKYGTFVELGSVPSVEWDALAEFGFDAVWLMGVWERSWTSVAMANSNQSLLEDFQRALPDFHPLDSVGSPYSVRSYAVDQLLGGPAGLAIARQELANRGMRLLLDFVPNQVAPDHPWAVYCPEFCIRGNAEELMAECGREPDSAALPDAVQLNAFHPGLRQAVKNTIAGIARQCDGVRCSKATLLLNSVFEQTWGSRTGERPETEYWAEAISNTKAWHPNFLFIAEADAGREWELQQQGFDLCYDMTLYDRLGHGTAKSVRLHLSADAGYQEKLVRFVENHDEPRAATTFPPAKVRAAAVAMATLPGARLFHEGQFEGRRVKLPVYLSRRPTEPVNRELRDFYKRLLKVIDSPVFHDGQWRLCETAGWPDNASHQNLAAWSWVKEAERCLIVVNLSDGFVQARVRMPWNDVEGETWHLLDTLSGTTYNRQGDEIQHSGLYVELGPWKYHLFECQRMRQELVDLAA